MKALLSLFMLLVFVLAVVDSVIRAGQSFHFLISTINWRNLERTFIESQGPIYIMNENKLYIIRLRYPKF